MSCPTAGGANTFAVALECIGLVGPIDVAIAGARESNTEMDSWSMLRADSPLDFPVTRHQPRLQGVASHGVNRQHLGITWLR